MLENHKKTRVAVLFGGRSGEHEISLISARNIMDAMDKDRFEIIPVGITKEGRWLAGGDPMRTLSEGVDTGSISVSLHCDPRRRGLMPMDRDCNDNFITFDVVFPVLHGTFGEDGTLQGLLEMADAPYVGAGVLASSAGMDKGVMKSIFRDAGLLTPDFFVLKRRDWEKNRDSYIHQAEERFGFPCFVKPANLGSSVGISKAHDREELLKAVDLAAQYDRRVIVEEFIHGRELEIAVLGNDAPMASAPGEIIPCNEFYDYEAKYIKDDTKLIIPAELDEKIIHDMQRMAIKAFSAVDCAGMARIDFLLSRKSNKVYINEINTIPGFTKISMYPKLMAVSGVGYTELITRLIDLALELYEDKKRCRRDYSPAV